MQNKSEEMSLEQAYETLGLTEKATPTDIRNAYKSLALQTHPDRNLGNKEKAEEKFKKVSDAYGLLSDPEKRKQSLALEDSKKLAIEYHKDIVPVTLAELDKGIVVPEKAKKDKEVPLPVKNLYKPAKENEILDCYKLLGVDRKASTSLIEAIFIKLLAFLMGKRHHNAQDERALNRLVYAGETLTVPAYRQQHDKALEAAEHKKEEEMTTGPTVEEIKEEPKEQHKKTEAPLMLEMANETEKTQFEYPQLTEKGEPGANESLNLNFKEKETVLVEPNTTIAPGKS